MNAAECPPHEQLFKFIVGKWISKPIYIVAKLGIADMLNDGPKSIDELASMSTSHAPSLYRILRALASVGIFSELENRHFALTPMAECLKTGFMRSHALMFNADWNDKAWMHLGDCVKTGETAFEKAHGMPLFAWLENNPLAAELLHEANAIKAATSHRAIVKAYDFAGINTLTDIGGGRGTLMAEILKAHPLMKGFVADLASVLDDAKETIQMHALQDRCETVVCNFFQEIPTSSDACLLSHILHDWSDDYCKTILKNCYIAMKKNSKLLIVEMIIPPGNEPSVAKLLDLEMMVITGGCERTEPEFKELLESTGFKVSRIFPTRANICLMEGIRV